MRLDAFDITPGEALDLGPVALKIHNDTESAMPWADFDGCTPLAWWTLGRGRWESGHLGNDSDLARALEGVAETWATRHRAAIWAALDLTPAQAEAEESDIAQEARDYGAPRAQVRLERMAERLAGMYPADLVEAAAAIWRLRGIHALAFQRNGYCQGDSVLGLLVQTPAFLEAVGLGHPDKREAADIAADLEGEADLFGAWAFGDVYGYSLEDSEGETLDSCWGFYGCPWGNNPRRDGQWDVLEAAEDALNAEAPHQVERWQVAAQVARRAFLEARQEAKAAAAEAKAPRPVLCAVMRGHLEGLAATWREAKARAAAWAALGGQEVGA